MLSKSDVKYIQSLAHKKFREEYGHYIVEGVKMVEELISQYPELLFRVYATRNWVSTHPGLVKNLTCLYELEDFELEKISFLNTPNEVLALAKLPPFTSEIMISGQITMVLDQIQDPGNLGTIIRTCDWFGVKNIICSTDTADAYNPKVVQSTMGSIFRTNIIYTDIVSFVKKHSGIPIYAALLDGASIYTTQFQFPSILIVGNESKGISNEIKTLTTNPVTIDKIGSAESLNASIAAGIILSHMLPH
jgi:TrmH family RNA methyltransferase